MITELEPIKWSIRIRILCFVLLTISFPFIITGVYHERGVFTTLFPIVIYVVLLPEIFIKVFLKPISATMERKFIIANYVFQTAREIHVDEIKGYSQSREKTNDGTKFGVVLYLRSGPRIDFTEINIKDTSPLVDFLNKNDVLYYGEEKSNSWFVRKYKYTEL